MRPAFALGLLLYAFLDAHRLHCCRAGSEEQWRRAVTQLDDAAAVDGLRRCLARLLRTLFRLAFTKKHMLDWVTSADAAAGGTRVRHGAAAWRSASLLLLPGRVQSAAWLPPALALIALFLVDSGAGLRDHAKQSPTDARETAGTRARSRGASRQLAQGRVALF